MEHRKALLIIDYTNDFVDKNGALTCGENGQAIDSNISRLCEEFLNNGDYLFFMNDLHYQNDKFHPEAKLFPPHNILGTWGRELYGETGSVYEQNKEKENVVGLDKTRYSCFAGTQLSILLEERGIKDVTLCGVCTDICVLHTAVDAYNLGLNITVPEHCVASFNQVGHSWALEHFKNTLNAAII